MPKAVKRRCRISGEGRRNGASWLGSSAELAAARHSTVVASSSHEHETLPRPTSHPTHPSSCFLHQPPISHHRIWYARITYASYHSFVSAYFLSVCFSKAPPNMKSTLVAAAALLGSAQAGVHKMKLQKISLAEQLVRYFPHYHRMEPC